ncbi:MAG: hypothetical protein ACK4SB_00440 [Belliella pelovolcani]
MGLYSEKGLAYGKTFLLLFYKFKLQKFGFENIYYVFLNHKIKCVSMKGLITIFSLVFLITVALGQESLARTTNNNSDIKLKVNAISFNTVTLKIANDEAVHAVTLPEIAGEDALADFGSPWAWPEFTLEMVDSYMPFIFRTKSSAEIEEVRVILNVNNQGKLVGYEMITEADRGLEQRIAHVLRKLPKCLPVPGYSNYEATDFELIIKR